MIEKLFGETPEEQYQYLKPRLMATAISLVLLLLGGVLYLLGLTFGEVLAGAGSILFAVVTLVFGWAILRGLLGFAFLGVLFSNNVVWAQSSLSCISRWATSAALSWPSSASAAFWSC